ncbi:MAG TPA: 6-carboxytetrahydropterin synthase, partial [Arthrobacter sp.]
LAQYVADAVAAQIRTGADGRELAGLDVTLRETPDAWASYSLDFEAS